MFKNSEISAMITIGLTRFVNAMMRYTNSDAIVKSVDKTSFTCVLTLNQGNTDVYDVPLRVLIGSQASFIEIPKQGTNAIVCFLDHNMSRPKLLECHEVDEIIITVGNSVLDITNGLFNFNGGNNGGLVLAQELQTQSNKDKQILDALLNIINGVPINEPGNGAPSALQVALKAVLSTLQSGTWDNLENDKIKQ